MRVKVTPSYDGAGSWTTDCVWVAGKWRDEETLAEYPASWCEKIPEVVPEPGDIVEGEHGLPFFYDPVKTYSNVVRVLARKPKGGLDAHDAIHEFFRDLSDAETASADVAAYNKFLSAILGVPYGRVEG